MRAINVRQKGVLKIQDIIPCAYWLRRYSWKGIGMLIFRLVLQDVFILFSYWLATDSKHSDFTDFIIYYIFARVAFLAAYEIGYFVNDYWSEPREREKNSGTYSNEIPKIRLSLAVFVRIILVVVLLNIIGEIFNKYDTGLWIYLGVTQGIFLLHNIIFFPARILTYLGLQAMQYALPVLYLAEVSDKASLYSYTLLVLPLVISWTLNYSAKRGFFEGNNILAPEYGYLNPSSGAYVIRSALLIFMAIFICLLFIDRLNDLYNIISISAMLIVFGIVFDIYRFTRRVKSAENQSNVIYHMHTYMSHDSDNAFEDLVETAEKSGIQNVYITDHAEDFDFYSYEDLKRQCNQFSNNRIKLHPGLEYDILGQHFLCLNLMKFIDINASDVKELDKLKHHSSKLIWAHPFFHAKKLLFNSSYRKNWKSMAAGVDAMEIINFKSLNRKWMWWRHVYLCYFGVAFGDRQLSIGADAHTKEHLEKITRDYPYDLIQRVVKRSFAKRLIYGHAFRDN